MFEVGEAVKWMCPLDNDYCYGEIVSIKKCFATIKGTGLYRNITADVHFRYIERITGGRKRGGGKRKS